MVIVNNTSLWTGVPKQAGGSGSGGMAGNRRRAGRGMDEWHAAGRACWGLVPGIDGFVAADIDGDGQVEVVIYNN